jgi:multidrug efflux system membrane fusion protein
MESQYMSTLLKARSPLAVTALSLVVVGAVATGLYAHSQPSRAGSLNAAAAAVPVSVAVAAVQNVSVWSGFSGRLEAVDHVDIRSRVAGTIQSVHFREGALVKAGELLLSIDSAPFRAEVDRATAQMLAAQARSEYAKTELERAQRLWSDHAIARHDLDESVNAARVAEADRLAARAALQTARLNLGYTEVRAPVAGRVGKLGVTRGNLVSAGPDAPVLTTLVSDNPIYASFDADEEAVSRALNELSGGADARTGLARIPVRIETGDGAGASHAGHLQLIDNQVDARSGTVHVRAILENKDGTLMPGQFVRISLGQSRPHPALLVAERAIGTDQDKRFVMVVGNDGKAAYRQLVLGGSVGKQRIVTAGLRAGERVIVSGLQHVQPGVKVSPQTVSMSAGDGQASPADTPDGSAS